MSISPATGSMKASDVLIALKAKLVTALQAAFPDNLYDSSFVRLVVKPNPTLVEYKAEQNIALRFPVAEPDTTSGASRYGMMVTRNLEVWVFTQDLSDKAGDETILVTKHLDLEEAIIDILHDARPTLIQNPTGERIGIKVRFIPGGQDIERNVKRDTGFATSVLLFEVTYQLAFSVKL